MLHNPSTSWVHSIQYILFFLAAVEPFERCYTTFWKFCLINNHQYRCTFHKPRSNCNTSSAKWTTYRNMFCSLKVDNQFINPAKFSDQNFPLLLWRITWYWKIFHQIEKDILSDVHQLISNRQACFPHLFQGNLLFLCRSGLLYMSQLILAH